MSKNRYIILLYVGIALFLMRAVTVEAQPITVPTDLNPGDQYRLVFLTAYSMNPMAIGNSDACNTFVTDNADMSPELIALHTTWSAIASWPDIDARHNTGTHSIEVDSVPIYDLVDRLIANDNADLWDGSIMNPICYNQYGEYGDLQPLIDWVWTGSDNAGYAQTGRSMADAYTIQIGHSNYSDSSWISYYSWSSQEGYSFSLYAMSDVLTVPNPVPEPTTMLLLGSGLIGLAGFRRKFRKN